MLKTWRTHLRSAQNVGKWHAALSGVRRAPARRIPEPGAVISPQDPFTAGAEPGEEARMHYALLLKEIARGQHGARPLSRVDSAGLFTDALQGVMPDAVLGALLVALRMKGETLDELLGLHDAWQVAHAPLALPPANDQRLPVVIGSFNGARRQPNLLPLLALLLTRLGLTVLIHGVRTSAGRVATREIFAELGIETATNLAHATSALRDRRLAFVPLDVLSPSLARLLAWRDVLGVRHLGHTLVKVMNPCRGPALVIAGYTHPPYRALMEHYFAGIEGQALLMRGAEGEAVASAHRLPAPLWCHGGTSTLLAGFEEARVPAPCELDAVSTAAFTRHALAQPAAIPQALLAQLRAVLIASGAAPDESAAGALLQAKIGRSG